MKKAIWKILCLALISIFVLIAADGPAEVILRDQALLEANDLELPFCFAGR